MFTNNAKIAVVDLETCYTEKNSAVLSLGGVRVVKKDVWTPDENTIYLEFNVQDQFDRGLVFNPGTITWHLKQGGTRELLTQILTLDPQPANEQQLNLFNEWYRSAEGESVLFACRGTNFDPEILGNLLRVYGRTVPYTHTDCIDIRSLQTVMELVDPQPPKRPYNERPHHALSDAVEEAHHLCDILNKLDAMFGSFHRELARNNTSM